MRSLTPRNLDWETWTVPGETCDTRPDRVPLEILTERHAASRGALDLARRATLARVRLRGALAGRDEARYVASGSATTAWAAVLKAPSRHAMTRASDTIATMIVEIALIWGVTPNLIEL